MRLKEFIKFFGKTRLPDKVIQSVIMEAYRSGGSVSAAKLKDVLSVDEFNRYIDADPYIDGVLAEYGRFTSNLISGGDHTYTLTEKGRMFAAEGALDANRKKEIRNWTMAVALIIITTVIAYIIDSLF